MDSVLARDCGGDSQRNHLTREIPEGAAVLFDSAVRLAFLGGLRRASMGSSANRLLVVRDSYGKEALIARCIPKDIARWQPHGRHEVVFERGLLACREAHYVHGRVPAVLFA